EVEGHGVSPSGGRRGTRPDAGREGRIVTAFFPCRRLGPWHQGSPGSGSASSKRHFLMPRNNRPTTAALLLLGAAELPRHLVRRPQGLLDEVGGVAFAPHPGAGARAGEQGQGVAIRPEGARWLLGLLGPAGP